MRIALLLATVLTWALMPAAYAADIDVAPPQAAEPTPPEPMAAISYTVSIPVPYPHPWWCGYLGMPASLRCVAWRLRVGRPSAPLGRSLIAHCWCGGVGWRVPMPYGQKIETAARTSGYPRSETMDLLQRP